MWYFEELVKREKKEKEVTLKKYGSTMKLLRLAKSK